MKIPAGDSLIAPASWQATFSKCRTGACWMEEPESAAAKAEPVSNPARLAM